MTIAAGIDVGAGTAKALILINGQIASYHVLPSGYDTLDTARKTIQEACGKASVSFQEIERIFATGYSRSLIPFAAKTMTEITCHARGAYFLIPQARSIIDIGCQDSKAIKLDSKGKVINFIMNDKCAAGTGRFIEVMAHTLGLRIEEVGITALSSKNPCEISSTCTIFAETEIISQRAQGRAREDLIAGTLKSIAKRVGIMAAGIGLVSDVAFTGGVAKNVGVKKALEETLDMKIIVPEEPQIVGALGAALFADDDLRQEKH